MDYLDPRKRRRHTILLFIGYGLISIAIVIATFVLLYQTDGFGIDKKGIVIQNGLVFVSSQPRPADVLINGKVQSSRTNTRLALPEAIYDLKIQRSGYQDWQRQITVEGGQVVHYDYPFLIPKSIKSTSLVTYDQAPTIFSQSPDKRWLLVGQPAEFTSFDLYDLKNPTKAPTVITLPETVITAAKSSQSWQIPEWADDSQHLVLQHQFDNSAEYILLDRQAPEQSVNLSQALALKGQKLALMDRKFDRYYLHDTTTLQLSQATLKNPVLTEVLSSVLTYKAYGTNTILYATATGASEGKVRVELKVNDRNYTIRSLSAGTTYVLDITKYNNTFYVVAGATSEDKVYVYRDPAGQIGANYFSTPTPLQVLRVSKPNFVGFSSSAQYIVAENGAQFSVYDIEYKRSYNYVAKQIIDTPQLHATWMDGNRLSYVSQGQQVIFDYDYQNVHILGKADPTFKPIFAPDYKYSYTVSPSANSSAAVLQTGLLIPSEL